jgi:hypothetical protein
MEAYRLEYRGIGVSGGKKHGYWIIKKNININRIKVKNKKGTYCSL